MKSTLVQTPNLVVAKLAYLLFSNINIIDEGFLEKKKMVMLTSYQSTFSFLFRIAFTIPPILGNIVKQTLISEIGMFFLILKL